MKNNEIKLSKEQADEFINKKHIKLTNEQVDEFINMVEEVGHYGEQQIDSFYDKLVKGLSKFIPKRFLKK